MSAANALVTAPLPPQPVLQALLERLREGLLLFTEDGQVALANPAAQNLLASGSDGGLPPPQRLRELLPPDALEQARQHGHWNGSLPLGEGVVIAHLYHHGPVGEGHFLALFRHIEGQEDYERELQQRHAELRQAYLRLNGTQEKLLQSGKMASIGQLAAGVAHEINNPIGYVHSNLGSLQEYLRSLFTVIEAYERALRAPDPKALIPEIDDIRDRLDIDFISRDLPQLMAESREGIERVTRIVRDLKDFSYSGRDESWKLVDLHAGLESTINIIWNELKYKVTLVREFGQLPLVECLPSELNQVYMNLLLNAGHAIAERGTITDVDGTPLALPACRRDSPTLKRFSHPRRRRSHVAAGAPTTPRRPARRRRREPRGAARPARSGTPRAARPRRRGRR